MNKTINCKINYIVVNLACKTHSFPYNLTALKIKLIKMVTETILKPIGNWQITIPLDRRQFLHIDKKHVRARLEGNQIIIQSLDQSPVDWDVKRVNLKTLTTPTQHAIKSSHKHYIAWKNDAFISHDAFRNGI